MKSCQFIFNLALQLHEQPEQLTAVESLRHQAIHAMNDLKIPKMSANDLLAVRYALAALVDELAAYSTWSSKAQWLAQPLQVILFGDHVAGEKFFERLTHLQQTSSTPVAVLEVYYICLQLGFQGKHRLHDPNVLIELKHRLAQQIIDQQPTAVMEESTQASPTLQPNDWQHYVVCSIKSYGWVWGVIGLLYLGYHGAIWQLKQSFM